MTGEIFNSTDQKRNKFFWRYVFAAIIFLMLILIWPLSLLKITDPYVNNRLLKQEGDYSYFYVSSGEYLTTVIKGNGELVPNVAIRLRFQEEVPENASMEAYVFDSEGNVVIDQHISIFPRPENDIYEIPFDLELGKDRSYQFVLAPESDFTIGVYCSNGTSEPAVLLPVRFPVLLSERTQGRRGLRLFFLKDKENKHNRASVPVRRVPDGARFSMFRRLLSCGPVPAAGSPDCAGDAPKEDQAARPRDTAFPPPRFVLSSAERLRC